MATITKREGKNGVSYLIRSSVGYDSSGTARYAALRGTIGMYKGEASGSARSFSTGSIPAPAKKSLENGEYKTLDDKNNSKFQVSHKQSAFKKILRKKS